MDFSENTGETHSNISVVRGDQAFGIGYTLLSASYGAIEQQHIETALQVLIDSLPHRGEPVTGMIM